MSRPALGPSEPPLQWVSGAFSPMVKRQAREADHSPPTSAWSRKLWIYTSIPWHSLWCSAQGQLYLTLYVTCRVVHVSNKTGCSSDDWIYWQLGYILSLNHIYIQAIQHYRSFRHFRIHCCAHTSPLLVTDLKHRNHKSLTESHTPSITHRQSLQITCSSLLQLRNSRGCLPPRTNCKRTSVSPMTPRTDNAENTSRGLSLSLSALLCDVTA
jgi:hypothetical protein